MISDEIDFILKLLEESDSNEPLKSNICIET